MLNRIPISEIMTSTVITLKPLDTFDNAAQVFRTNNIHHIPIVDEDNKVKGIVSKSDYHALCDRFTLFSEALGDKVNNNYFSSLLMSDVMHKSPVCLTPDDSLTYAISIFQENRFHAMPVVDENKEIVGILSTFDALKYLDLILKGKKVKKECITCSNMAELKKTEQPS